MDPDGSLQAQVCFSLHAASRATTTAYRGLLDSLGLTYPQYLVMLALWEQDGRAVGDLCAALDLDTGTLSPLLKRLEARGLVERRRRASDERRVDIHLSEAGRELEERASHIPARLAEATGLSPAELDALRETLDRLRHALAATDHGD
ncbi:MarR family winged helix-turn-helix transcriptional regulator [Actinotalea sp.]|uniref:MarR family winged helix-turn-helix transcriptional regulator n=1 Tax=Actinotalea sp. TaxID=1872145 RepID=UPI003563F3EC